MASITTVPTRWQRKARPSILFIPSASTTNEPITIAIAIPQNAIPPMTPSCVAFRSNDRPQAGRTSCRITNEKADATRAMQLATNRSTRIHALGLRSGRSPPHGAKGLENSRELFLDNRAASALPGGTRSPIAWRSCGSSRMRRRSADPARRPSLVTTRAVTRGPRRRPWSGWSPGCSPSAPAGGSSGVAAPSSSTAASRAGSPATAGSRR